jgi:sulfur-carrier protein
VSASGAVIGVSVRVPASLRRYSGGKAVVHLDLDEPAPSVGRVFDALATPCPGVVDRVLDERGELRRHVNVFVGDEEVRAVGGLDAPVADGAELSIFPAVSGG